MADYPPYVNAYGSIPKLFEKIKDAAVPPKFTQDFVSTMLGLKSSSYRAMIPLLKRLGFIDQDNVPTQAYKDFRDPSLWRQVMAERLRDAYQILFSAHEYAWKLKKEDLQSALGSVTGTAKNDSVIPVVVSTFLELSKLADWEKTRPNSNGDPSESANDIGPEKAEPELPGNLLRLSYTINLNLPATTEIEVFNAIFKSLRENLLRA
ncbi:MAG: DUF5343 domain-containing protein [Candidatus Binataceae bacterium]